MPATVRLLTRLRGIFARKTTAAAAPDAFERRLCALQSGRPRRAPKWALFRNPA